MVTLAISIIIAFIAGFIVALVSIKIGLKWRIELSQGKEPTLNINPITPIVEAVQQTKVDAANKYSSEQVSEWLYGAKDGSDQ